MSIKIIAIVIAVIFVASLAIAGVVTFKGAITRAVKAEADLKSCGEKYTATLVLVKKQNDTILGLNKESEAAKAKAKEALRLATEQAKLRKAEIDRLTALLGPGVPIDTVCPAGLAVIEAKKERP